MKDPRAMPWGDRWLSVGSALFLQLHPESSAHSRRFPEYYPAVCGQGRLLPLQSSWSYRQAQVSTDMLGYTFRTTFRFSSRKRTPRELILSGTQHGSGMPGTMPTALTMLWMVAWLDGRTIYKGEGSMVTSELCPPHSPHHPPCCRMSLTEDTEKSEEEKVRKKTR